MDIYICYIYILCLYSIYIYYIYNYITTMALYLKKHRNTSTRVIQWKYLVILDLIDVGLLKKVPHPMKYCLVNRFPMKLWVIIPHNPGSITSNDQSTGVMFNIILLLAHHYNYIHKKKCGYVALEKWLLSKLIISTPSNLSKQYYFHGNVWKLKRL